MKLIPGRAVESAIAQKVMTTRHFQYRSQYRVAEVFGAILRRIREEIRAKT